MSTARVRRLLTCTTAVKAASISAPSSRAPSSTEIFSASFVVEKISCRAVFEPRLRGVRAVEGLGAPVQFASLMRKIAALEAEVADLRRQLKKKPRIPGSPHRPLRCPPHLGLGADPSSARPPHCSRRRPVAGRVALDSQPSIWASTTGTTAGDGRTIGPRIRSIPAPTASFTAGPAKRLKTKNEYP
jgi:hypothetical protein